MAERLGRALQKLLHQFESGRDLLNNQILYELEKMLNLKGKSILITGGTGSFGKMFTKLILKNNPDVKRLVILSPEMNKNILICR